MWIKLRLLITVGVANDPSKTATMSYAIFFVEFHESRNLVFKSGCVRLAVSVFFTNLSGIQVPTCFRLISYFLHK